MAKLNTIKQRFGIIGQSELLNRALDTAVRVAPTDLSVLITGESGVGKEVFSKIIHHLSTRKHAKSIAINCGAIPEGTINSELFGHEKGAFTGATSERKGYFESHNGGTIFLDEIGEMPLDTQVYLLRILETGEFIRVGSAKVQKTDIRIIAATNVDLADKVKKGKFREDLYYRLNTVPIKVPALRERPGDIYMLFRKFAVDFAEKYRTEPVRLDEQAHLLLESYRWPGNIRELKNVAEQVSVLAEKRLITAEDLVKIIPSIQDRNLPIIQPTEDNNAANLQEREILFKFLFDMKSDLNDLKKLVYEMIRNNNLSVSSLSSLREFDLSSVQTESMADTDNFPVPSSHRPDLEMVEEQPNRPIILDNSQQQYSELEIVDENLSLEENEKMLIKRALKKHNGKRKEAAQDLEISERTLYRKIKHYDLQ